MQHHVAAAAGICFRLRRDRDLMSIVICGITPEISGGYQPSTGFFC